MSALNCLLLGVALFIIAIFAVPPYWNGFVAGWVICEAVNKLIEQKWDLDIHF